jgi:hypothetical protein
MELLKNKKDMQQNLAQINEEYLLILRWIVE